jgi:hypothetical protein
MKDDPTMRVPLTRRRLLGLMAGTAMLPPIAGRLAAQPAAGTITVSKDPNCGCCNGWVDHLRKAGFPVTVAEPGDMNALKARLGIPPDLASCHTAEVGGYVIEGHVPADAIARLLREAPRGRGLAVPGMPVGSPGMEGGAPETYEVVLFGDICRSVFARYRGAAALKARQASALRTEVDGTTMARAAIEANAGAAHR